VPLWFPVNELLKLTYERSRCIGMAKKIINKKILFIACILCALVAVTVFSTIPVLADNTTQIQTVAIKAVTTSAGTAERVVDGRQFSFRKNTQVVVSGLYGDRYVVKYRNRIYLYAASSIAFKTSKEAVLPTNWPSLEDVLRSTVVTEMKKYLGKPYVWGANGPKEFDCSGLTQYVYRVALGYKMLRTTYQQQHMDDQITMEEAQPGDLLFFKEGIRGERYGVSHTGMYIGNMQMIDAKGKAFGVVTDTLGKGEDQPWPVKVVSPIKAIMRRYPPVAAAKVAELDETPIVVALPNATSLPDSDAQIIIR
jgi:cell wall-associated NlpC family hydrolase